MSDPSLLRQAQDDREAFAPPASPGTLTIEHVFPDGTPDDPVAAIGHSAVFTLERRIRFLDNLAFKGNVRAAAALVGVSHETVYRARRQDAAFAALWDAALVQARGYSESALATRALDGVEVAIVHRGEVVGYRVQHDTRLLLAHLARLDRQVEADAAARARAGRFDELLAHYAGHEAPEEFAAAGEELRDSRTGDAGGTELPPTRAEFVAWHAGLALDALEAARVAAEPAACRRDKLLRSELAEFEAAETKAMEAAAQAAGAEWDAWRDGALARVEAIVAAHAAGEGEDEAEGEEDLAPADLPYEIKSAPWNRVTSVNPPRDNCAVARRSVRLIVPGTYA